MRKVAVIVGICVIGLLVACMTAWASLAIYYSDLPGEHLKAALSGLFALSTLAAFIFLPHRTQTLFWFFGIFVLVVLWWTTIEPSNVRDWQLDVAVLPYATIDGNLVTLHNIRNFTYRSETDFDAHYYDKTFDLTKLDSVDLISVYWMGDAIAHIMLSFGFGGKDYVAFSIEARKEKNEGYSSIKGFFRQYELIYIVADERDLIRLRTDYRDPQEDVYLYHTRITPENAQKLFMEYISKINQLKERPEFYNTLTTNCTTNVVTHIRAFGGKARYNWKILLSGYAPRYAYELGELDTTLAFEELRQRSHINPLAHSIGSDPDFSIKVREDHSFPISPPLRSPTGKSESPDTAGL
jgi:hypothetical protein